MTDLAALLNHHRSIRRYKPDPIDAAVVERVCGDAIAGAARAAGRCWRRSISCRRGGPTGDLGIRIGP